MRSFLGNTGVSGQLPCTSRDEILCSQILLSFCLNALRIIRLCFKFASSIWNVWLAMHWNRKTQIFGDRKSLCPSTTIPTSFIWLYSLCIQNETNGGKLSTDVLGGKRESFSVDSSPDSNHREATPERYPDTLDIDEMDYSPARRKPPIHNWSIFGKRRKHEENKV